ncbi:MAG: class I SAM-dependent methyltransferase [Azonexus sp.]|jgi:SAM-dependent methyltransferase|nr:class I SAM-dependent methyltransferase [Azonexus sp.]
MSGAAVATAAATTIADFLDYWQDEGERYARHGDYAWMADLASSVTPGRRILEIGCGPGFSTAALVERGLSVLVVDALPECLAATQKRIGNAELATLAADIAALTDEQRGQIAAFAPQTVVCWLMGAPAEITEGSAADAGQAVVAYREKTHRAVAEFAASLPGVGALHLVDRTAIAWQAKDIGRDTLVRYHLGKTLRDLPFAATREQALFRKLAADPATLQAAARALPPAFKNAIPALASLIAKRNN